MLLHAQCVNDDVHNMQIVGGVQAHMMMLRAKGNSSFISV
jgi:hypothetical protein